MFNLIKTCSKLFQCVQKFIQNANVCPNDLVALTNIVQKKDKAEFYSFSLSLTMVLQIKLLSAFFAFTTTIYYQYNIVHTCTSTSRQYKACQLRQFLKKDIDLVDTIYLQSACSFSSLPRKEDRTNWFLKKRGDFENLIKSFARMLLLGNESLYSFQCRHSTIKLLHVA